MLPAEIQDFIWQNREADPHKLAIQLAQHPDFQPFGIPTQVAALQKIKRKIPTWHRRGMLFPASVSVEQASSEATAKFKSSLFSGERFADLTGGLGADSFFFSKNFEEVFHVEQNAELLKTTQSNFEILGAGNVRFFNASAENFLRGNDQNFDLIYLDPARRDDKKGRVFQLSDCSPNAPELAGELLQRAPKVLVKAAPLLDIQLGIKALRHVSRVWVVEWEGECREVLFLLERQNPPPDEVLVSAVSLPEARGFEFDFKTEKNAVAEFSRPLKFLVEPSPAILKAGAFKSFGQRFGLKKLHPNSHLFTCENLPENLPARTFGIEAVTKFDKRETQKFLPGGKANVAARNFPENAEAVRKKLGLRDGGDFYLFATTDFSGKRIVLVCRKVGAGT